MIEWKLPDEDEPGYLRRRRKLAVLLEVSATSRAVDESVEHLLSYVLKPEDRKEAREALLDLSVTEFRNSVLQLMGYKLAAVPDPLGDKSATR